MTSNERRVLKELCNRKDGIVPPVVLINEIAAGDRGVVENLVTEGYIEEVPREVPAGYGQGMKVVNFYRTTPKGRALFMSWPHRAWYSFRENTALYVGIASIFFGLLSSILSFFTIQHSLDANKINERVANLEYSNSQPFLTIAGGNSDGTAVVVQNAGGGPAKNIFMLKQSLNTGNEAPTYFLTRESDIALALASEGQGTFNLSNQAMLNMDSIDELKSQVPCLDDAFFSITDKNWIAIFYENIKGEKFYSKAYGSGDGYSQALEVSSLTCTN